MRFFYILLCLLCLTACSTTRYLEDSDTVGPPVPTAPRLEPLGLGTRLRHWWGDQSGADKVGYFVLSAGVALMIRQFFKPSHDHNTVIGASHCPAGTVQDYTLSANLSFPSCVNPLNPEGP